jgi:hypothetical protein
LTNSNTGSNILFGPVKNGDDKENPQFEFKVSFGDEVEKFQYQGGVYQISLLFGDTALVQPHEWLVGKIQLTFPSKPIVNLPLYSKALLYTSDTTLHELPEIEHHMRPPAKRASSFTALVFSLLVSFPLLTLTVSFVELKPTVQRLTSVASTATVVLFGGLLLLYGGYWLGLEGLSFYEAIKYLCCLYPVLLFVARSSLFSIISPRVQKAN